jgi:hypothetical protein
LLAAPVIENDLAFCGFQGKDLPADDLDTKFLVELGGMERNPILRGGARKVVLG